MPGAAMSGKLRPMRTMIAPFPAAAPVSVAPMMALTDRHARYFLRLLSRATGLYTEMVTTGAILHGDRSYLLDFDAAEQPLGLQLGGSEPEALARCARIAEQWGYAEVNLNVGCPSDRVKNGRFGACLMLEPERVADCVFAMREAVEIPVTVKTRIGVDDLPHWQGLRNFVHIVSGRGGCRDFIVHARRALLQGLSPRENREVPPLDYAVVSRLKNHFPDLRIVLNGGVGSLDETAGHLRNFDGVMIGRAAYYNPWMLAGVDQRFAGMQAGPSSPHQVLRDYLPYVQRQLDQGARLIHMSRHLAGLFQGVPGARRYRRWLSENAPRTGAGVEVIEQAMKLVPESFRVADKDHKIAI